MLRSFVRSSLLVRSIVMMIALGAVAMPTANAQHNIGGGDIVVLDIVDEVAKARQSAGGGDGDILVFDIVDSVADTRRPAGGGGGDILVFDIVDSVVFDSREARSGGGVMPDFVLVDGFASYDVVVLGESEIPGFHEVLVDCGDSVEIGLVMVFTLPRSGIIMGAMFVL